MTTDHAYPPQSLSADYLKALTGMLICLMPFAFGADAKGGMVILLACGGLFCLLAIRTTLKLITKISMDDEKISSKFPIRREIKWRDLSHMSLSYYSTWRSKDNGWMLLTIKSAGSTLRLESNVTGFEEIVGRSMIAAISAQLQLDQKTLQNAEAMNIAGPAGTLSGDEQLA